MSSSAMFINTNMVINQNLAEVQPIFEDRNDVNEDEAEASKAATLTSTYAATSAYKAVETCDAANNAIEIVTKSEDADLDDFNEIGKKACEPKKY